MSEEAPADLARTAFAGVAKFAVALAVLVFLPPLTLSYWQGWLFLANFATCAALVTLYLLRRDPELLQRRLNAGPAAESRATQKRIQIFASIAFCAILVVSALDHGLGWSSVPVPVVVLGNALVVLGFAVVLMVFRENSFAAAVIEVSAGQAVVSTGPYAWVRHPMYAGALVLMLDIPPALGSWWGLGAVVPMLGGLAARALDEERYLARTLPGYADYCARVRYRLLPGVW